MNTPETSAKLPISVFIICCDEADRIARPILSVREWVQEVVVVDSGSRDETVQIAKDLGAQVIYQEWLGFGPQKVYAESLCKQHWILNLDADEEVTPELRENIETLFAEGEPSHAAFKMRWKMLFEYQQKPSFFATRSTFVRLYDKRKSGFSDSQVHDSVLLREGTLGEVKGYVWHRNFTSLARWIRKMEVYTTRQAEDMYHKGRRAGTLRLLIEPFATFLKAYIIRRNVLYGMNGFIFSWLYSYSKVMRLAKLRELHQKEQMDKKQKP